MLKPSTEPTQSIQLSEAENRELQEEVKATNRSASSIVTEALRLRRMVLEALGIEAAGTDPAEVCSTAKRALEDGVRASRAANKRHAM